MTTLAAALDRSQMSFHGIQTADRHGAYVEARHPSGQVLGRITLDPTHSTFEVFSTSDISVGECEFPDVFALASICMNLVGGGTSVSFLDFTGLVKALNGAFGTRL